MTSTSLPPPPIHVPEAWIGIGAVLLCSILFGTYQVPIRRFHTHTQRAAGDGIFINWVMSIGILSVGLAVNGIEDSPPVMPLAIFGGSLWVLANSISQYVIRGLGLSVALLLWMSTTCLVGWASGHFGLFGLKANKPESALLNYAGLVSVLVGGISFAFVTNTQQKGESNAKGNDQQPPEPEVKVEDGLSHTSTISVDSSSPPAKHHREKKKSFLPLPIPIEVGAVTKMGKTLRGRVLSNSQRLIYIVLSLLSGFFYGATVIPVIYMEEHAELFPSTSRRGMPYLFGHYVGIFIGSTTIFIVYALFKRNRPSVNAQLLLPSLGGGAIWGVGMAMLFLSNDILTQTITYPVMTALPGCVSCLWSCLYFRECNGRRNYRIIAFAFVCIISGAVMVLLSKFKL